MRQLANNQLCARTSVVRCIVWRSNTKMTVLFLVVTLTRRVCSHSSSILNKLTPDKFDKLCLELLNVGVDSKLVLKGIILLVRTRTRTRSALMSTRKLSPGDSGRLVPCGADCGQSPRRAQV